MRIAVLIPDRGDRPLFLENCLRMMRHQTLRVDHIEIVSDKPKSDKPDITWRYRTGYDRLRGKHFDLIAFIENDDWYSPDYLEQMVSAWYDHGQPDIFGTNYTIYYHLRLRAYFTFTHTHRASAMNTFIRPDMDIKWPSDHEVFTDSWLWQSYVHRSAGTWGLFSPPTPLALGMKHGVGLCGGRSHIDKLERYANPDNGFLKRTLDPDSFEFYDKFASW